MADAAAPPNGARVEGAVTSDTTIHWQPSLGAVDYRIWWRDATAPHWQHNGWVGDASKATFENIGIDNPYFGVSAVTMNGYASPIVFPRDADSVTAPAQSATAMPRS